MTGEKFNNIKKAPCASANFEVLSLPDFILSEKNNLYSIFEDVKDEPSASVATQRQTEANMASVPSLSIGTLKTTYKKTYRLREITIEVCY